MSIIEVENLTKKYEQFTAVESINFKVKEGEIFGLLGPNGAGKTTTINMLIGLAKITKGDIKIVGIECAKNLSKIQEKIGIIPDESNLYPEMTGVENLSFCGALYGMNKKEREEKALQLLEQVGLSHVAEKPFKAYSKGMKRRLTIAAGIIHGPEILFLDEPTSGIDVESARQIRKLLTLLNRNGTTIFLTTHYIEEAERLCDRIAFIVEGKIVKIDSTVNLMEKAQQEKVVQFYVENSKIDLQSVLEKKFPNYRYKLIDSKTIRVYSKEKIDLLPFIELFKKHSAVVYEAKLVKPSLEEVFVQITGIETNKMKKEGGR
ncbi:ABC transporter ATP-binding protein [Proteinivorax tanatarense]|uniref:ABC transporter ATP-binding protein n=1 Tax=Proteinivorax tanatarense TaxID=1260629 RepID=A0AAU7VMM2_9FIRM